MNKLRAAVIGCGSIGSSMQDSAGAESRGICTHAAAYIHHPQTELVAFCDTNTRNLNQATDRWGNDISAHNDLESLLNAQKPQLVSVATHVDSHFEITKTCLEAPSVKGILLEKPISNELQEARELAALSAKLNKVLNVNYSRRFPPVFRKVAQDLQAEKWGKPVQVTGFYTKGLIHNGTHWLDLFRMLFGEPTVANAVAKLNLSNTGQGQHMDPMLSFQMGNDLVPKADIHAFPVDAHTVFEMDVMLTRGRLRFVDQTDTIEVYVVKPDHPFVGYQALDLATTHRFCLRDFVAHGIDDLVASVNHSTKSASPISSAIRNIELATQIIDSYSPAS